MGRRSKPKCLGCGELFVPDRRNRHHQRYCQKPCCRKASKAASQRRWLAKAPNRDYFRGAENVARVQRWRQARPGYWRTKKRSRKTFKKSQPPPNQQDSSSRDLVTQPPDALQDHWATQPPLIVGLISTLTAPLQEDIASTAHRLIVRGQDILRAESAEVRQPKQGVRSYETKNTYPAREVTPHPGAI